MTDSTVIILGAGQGGFQVAASLRDGGHNGRILLVGDERELPYERPPLTKAFLLGTKSKPSLLLRPEEFYSKRKIELLVGEKAIELDRNARCVTLMSGSRLNYDHLVFATGARNRTLSCASGHGDVVYVRSLADAEAVQEKLKNCNEILIVGAGFIGLELSAVLLKLGKRVRVLEAGSRPMGRALSATASEFFTNEHRRWGADIVVGQGVAELILNGQTLSGARSTTGQTYPAELILVGIGVVPNQELAESSGLPVQNGILVNEYLRTPDPLVSAIGDCASFPAQFGTGRIRIESIQNAVDQARCVAAAILGQAHPYTEVPWFWSDQGDLKLQMVGLTDVADETVVRGNLADRKFSVFCYRAGKIVGVESVNRPSDHIFGRKLLARGMNATPSQVVDPHFDLKAHVQAMPKSANVADQLA